jgi:putative Mg2+ transporter-C (MgtC) family protein
MIRSLGGLMPLFSIQWLEQFWSMPVVAANLVVFLNLLGALLLGMTVGYERSYHGRAAGMRTYGIVCMASAALTVFVGYSEFWYGGQGGGHSFAADPTRVIQGIVTGVGFLGAGVIMKEGLNISGLTTAASIWAASAIGVLVGIGFYAAAILLTGLSAALMMWGSKVEARLPSRHAVGVNLRFAANCRPTEARVSELLARTGYELATQSISVLIEKGQVEWQFVAVVVDHKQRTSVPLLSAALMESPDIEKIHVSHARN